MVDRLLPFPFRELPRSEAELKAKYGEKAEGIGRLPWLVQESYARLVEAMKASDKDKILAESDVLGGLVVDLNSALNLTENFDGQKTGQHGLWVRLVEKLPQAHGREPQALCPTPPTTSTTRRSTSSPSCWAPTCGSTTRSTSRSWRGGARPATATPTSRTSPSRVGPILRERLSRAAEDTGSFWYTAWSVAGRPELK